MKKLLAIAAVVAATVSPSAMAQSVGSVYGELAYTTVSIKDVSSTDLGTFKPTAGRFGVGTVVHDNLAIEGFLLQGLAKDSRSVTVSNVAANVDVKLKTSYGVALRPFVNLNNDIQLFGRIGSVRAEIEGTVSANGRSVSDSSKSTHTIYGVGVSYKLNNAMSAIVDYTKLSTKEDTESSMVGFGIRYNF